MAKVYVVIEIYGRTSKIQAVSKGANVVPVLQPTIPNDECSGRFDILSEAIGELYNINNEDEIYTEPFRACQLKLAEPEASDPEENELDSADKKIIELGLESVNEFPITSPPEDTMMDPDELPTVFPQTENVRKRKYTFHNVCGKNVKLLGSETVACRYKSYDNGIVVLSKPLKRGESCWFTIEKMDLRYTGTLSIGAIPYLPIDPLPPKALDLPQPSWVLAADYMLNEKFVASKEGFELRNLSEGQSLSVRFEQNGDIVIVLDRKLGFGTSPQILSVIGVVRDYTEIYPLIDVYGQISQISTNIYPYYFATQLIYNENQLQCNIDPTVVRSLVKKGRCCIGANPSLIFYPATFPKQDELNDMTRQIESRRPISENLDVSLRSPRSPRTNNLHRYTHHGHVLVEAVWRGAPIAKSNLDDQGEGVSNENDEDHLDSELITALTLESGMEKDLPDLTEDQEWTLGLSGLYSQSSASRAENLNYIKRILHSNCEGADAFSLESEWDANQGCELLRTVLKYWTYLSRMYPELRNAVSWGQIKCFCSTCQKTGSRFSGWVRIERIDGVGAASKGYYHMTKIVIGATHTAAADRARPRRPLSLLPKPNMNMPTFDLWIDNDGKQYLITLALEIDTEGSQPENDRLLAILIYIRSPPPEDDASEA